MAVRYLPGENLFSYSIRCSLGQNARRGTEKSWLREKSQALIVYSTLGIEPMP